MSQSRRIVKTRSHEAVIWLNFDGPAAEPHTALADLEALCAEVRAAGGTDQQDVNFSRELSPRLTATVRLPLPDLGATTEMA